jgi:hypothetical protein
MYLAPVIKNQGFEDSKFLNRMMVGTLIKNQGFKVLKTPNF